MDYLSEITEPLQQMMSFNIYLFASMVLMLVIILFLHKTYRASLNVEARLAEFASLSGNNFGSRLKLIETQADEYSLNPEALGPLARIINEYSVITSDLNGRVTYCNDKFLQLSGFDQKACFGQYPDFAEDDTLPNNWHQIAEKLNQNRVWHGELAIITKTGNRKWLDCFVFPLNLITKNEDGYLFFGSDITMIKHQNHHLISEMKKRDETINKMEGMLYNSEKMASLGTISAGIAHEINNPIAFIKSNISRINEYTNILSSLVLAFNDHISREKVGKLIENSNRCQFSHKDVDFVLSDSQELIDETQVGIERICKIIRDLKSFSREQRDDYNLVDINHCIDVALNIGRHEIGKKIKLERNTDNLPRMLASESQLTQVFLNLIINAAHAMPEGGTIVIDAINNEKCCEIRISDTGHGIAEDAITTIFEPFFTTKPPGKGTGLGLSITQDILRRHDAEIDVSSTLNQGTTFTIRLPEAAINHERAA